MLLIERCVSSFCLNVHWHCYFGATNKLRDDRCQLLHRLCTLASMSHSSRSTPKFSYFINAPFNFRCVPSWFCLFVFQHCRVGCAKLFCFIHTAFGIIKNVMTNYKPYRNHCHDFVDCNYFDFCVVFYKNKRMPFSILFYFKNLV
jgi:hypothetical protein